MRRHGPVIAQRTDSVVFPSPPLSRLSRLGRLKSSFFSSKSPAKFFTQVAAKFLDKSHDL